MLLKRIRVANVAPFLFLGWMPCLLFVFLLTPLENIYAQDDDSGEIFWGEDEEEDDEFFEEDEEFLEDDEEFDEDPDAFFDEEEAIIIWIGTHNEYDNIFKGNKRTIKKWLRNQNLI